MKFREFCKEEAIKSHVANEGVKTMKQYNKECFAKVVNELEKFITSVDVSYTTSTHETYNGKSTFINFFIGDKMTYRFCYEQNIVYDSEKDCDKVSFWDVTVTSFNERYEEETNKCLWLPFIGWLTVFHHKTDCKSFINFVFKYGKKREDENS